MEELSDQDAFTARELHARGFGIGHIAELLMVDEALVDAAVSGRSVESEPVVRPVELMQPVNRPAVPVPVVVDPNAWPPPADASTVWDSVWISEGYGRGVAVRVRWVPLWGQRVRINDEHEVWCTYCGGKFHTTAELGHPFNGCPTGLLRAGSVGPIAVSFDPEDPNYVPEPPVRRRDAWGMPW